MALCCEECFTDDYLKDYIRAHGMMGTCEFCGATSIMCIETSELGGIFEPLIDLYTPIIDFMPLHDLKSREGDFIWEKLEDDWQIFSSSEYSENLIRDMYRSWSSQEEGDSAFLSSFVEREDEYWGDDLEHTNRLKTQWQDFCDELIYQNRFFHNRAIDLEVLESLFPVIVKTLSPGAILYRGRLSTGTSPFPCAEMGIPPTALCTPGRANPLGIGYLYLASDKPTVMAELRAGSGQRATIADMKVASELQLVDLRAPHISSPFMYGDRLENIVLHLAYLRFLGKEISRPILPGGNGIEYIPTQYLCEFIKKCGYDGVIYVSSVGPAGYNVAVFDETKIECLSTKLYP